MSSQAEVKPNAFLEWSKWVLVVALVVLAIAGNAIYAEQSQLLRVSAVLLLFVLAVGVAVTTAKGRRINQLRKEAWVEVRRMVRPTRQETTQTTLLVLAAVLFVALCFWFFDWMISTILSIFLG